jgi:hypothetical protein
VGLASSALGLVTFRQDEAAKAAGGPSHQTAAQARGRR